MTRAEWIGIAGLAAALAAFGVVSFHGSIKATTDNGGVALKAGLADVTSGAHEENRWTCPTWSLASVGCDPLRMNHPLYRRPAHIGENRHKAGQGGWGSWYYDAPENQGV